MHSTTCFNQSRTPVKAVEGHYRNFHIPSDLVVDQWASNIESSSYLDFLLLHNRETSFVA
jgi:hypothetical protein